jgi:hypothetical protein
MINIFNVNPGTFLLQNPKLTASYPSNMSLLQIACCLKKQQLWVINLILKNILMTLSTKRTKIYYWIFTALFAAFMLFASIPDALGTTEAMDFLHTKLGYPEYFTRFIGIAKVLGVIALLVPGFPRVREWAYAGFAFDLIGATYSMLSFGKPNASITFMLIPIALGTLSYIFWHKKLLTSVTPVGAYQQAG